MTKSTTVASKAFVAIVAAAMVFSLIAPAAKAATMSAEDLQAQIAALMAQIEGLKGGSMMAPAAGSCVAIPAPLTMGAKGANVTALQNYLIAAKQSIPAGATGFFGGQTKAALAAFQSANGIMPAVGYYGPVTAAKMAAMCTPVTPTTPGTTPTTPGTPSTTLKGEADLKSVDVEDGDDSDVNEGDEDAEVAVATVEFENGDAEISRLDVKLDHPTSTRPYDVFESFSLWVDGKKVADVDASSKSDYLGTDEDTIRFSGLKIVAMEDEELDISVKATIMNSVKTVNQGDWTMTVDSIRFFDADGVATTENEPSTSISGDATVTVDVAGADDKVTIKKASADPKEATLKVETNTSKSTHDIGVFNLAVDEDSSDVVVNDGKVSLIVSNPVGASTINSINVVDKVEVEVAGKTVTGKIVTSGNVHGTIAAGASRTLTYTLDFNELDLDSDSDNEATVSVTFKGQNSNYGNNVKVQVTTTGSDWDIEGVEPITTTGTYTGKEHTLNSADVTFSSYAWAVNTAGTLIDFSFTVSADEEDFDVLTASLASTTSGNATITAGVLSVTSGDATAIAGGFKVLSGDEATFRVRYTVSGANGTNREVKLTTVAGQTVPTDKQTSPTATVNVN